MQFFFSLSLMSYICFAAVAVLEEITLSGHCKVMRAMQILCNN